MTRRKVPTGAAAARVRVPGAAFLLSQLGYHSSRLWQGRLAPLGLDPRHVMLLRHVADHEGRSQQALGEALRIPPSRMVAIVDGLEQRGLLRRRPNPDDRRVRTLHLTREGRRVLGTVMEVSLEHERQLCTGLEPGEREQLIALLNRLAAEQGLVEGVHPGAADPDPGEGGSGRAPEPRGSA
jgi:DNA-binding MarR family transcriptional regulator